LTAQAWWVYLVECNDNTLYAGITTDVKRRIRQHNGELVGGAKYTRVRRPVVLRYLESAESRSEAGKQEYAIKKLNRAEKIEKIKNGNLKPIT